MESAILDNIVGSSLVPTIMSVVTGKMYGLDKLDLLYSCATIGTVISSVTCSLHSEIRLHTRSRNKLTLLITLLLTMSLCASIILFHILRHNLGPSTSYVLPEILQGAKKSSPSDVFHHHFYSDIIPGLIIFSQAILCLLARFELMNRAKRKFSSGEASILAQLISVPYLVWVLSIYSKLTQAGPFKVGQTTDILLNVGFTLFVVTFLPCYLFLSQRNTFARYFLLLSGVMISFYISHILVKTPGINNPLTWLVDHIFATHERISLFSLWLVALAACVGFSTSWSRMVGQTNSFARKIFHIAICVVFISGYNQDIEFTRFASGGMIIVMLVLEMIRAWNLWPLGMHLENVCRTLRGKWDNRYLTLSHIYLLIGTMIPLWLMPSATSPSKLSLSSGVLAVGVGDAAAALIGTLYGRTHLGLRSGKTLEGFIGNILAMAVFKLIWIGYSGFLDEFSFAFAAILTASVEVISCNCDNLILPLVMIISLELL
uniref:dolichol kinase n=1 Tax=Aceria tosichella TaxID=561515 RepID=A0A6G1SIP9_9ACAR